MKILTVLKLFFLAATVGFSTVLFADNYQFHHLALPKTIVLEDTGDVLTLRGAALHKFYFEDSYIGAFYTLHRVDEPSQALLDVGPKRMSLYFLHSMDNVKGYWQNAIEENNSPAIVQREQISISQFIKLINYPLHEGDTLVLDYVPNVGTRVIVKGVVKGVIKGEEFYNLVLKVWLGRLPPSEKFRKDLFNLT